MSKQDSFKDWRGQKVKVGDTVLYPRSHNQVLEIIEGVVSELVWDSPDGTPLKVRIEPLRSSRFLRGCAEALVPPEFEKTKSVLLSMITNITKVRPSGYVPIKREDLEYESWWEINGLRYSHWSMVPGERRVLGLNAARVRFLHKPSGVEVFGSGDNLREAGVEAVDKLEKEVPLSER